MSSVHIEHMGLWSPDIERLRDFYTTNLGAVAGDRYTNEENGFTSYFLSWPDERGGTGTTRLEIMWKPEVEEADNSDRCGWSHIAFRLGSRAAVDQAAEQFMTLGYPLLSPPVETGDGYYECVIADPDGNRVELTA